MTGSGPWGERLPLVNKESSLFWALRASGPSGKRELLYLRE